MWRIGNVLEKLPAASLVANWLKGTVLCDCRAAYRLPHCLQNAGHRRQRAGGQKGVWEGTVFPQWFSTALIFHSFTLISDLLCRLQKAHFQLLCLGIIVPAEKGKKKLKEKKKKNFMIIIFPILAQWWSVSSQAWNGSPCSPSPWQQLKQNPGVIILFIYFFPPILHQRGPVPLRAWFKGEVWTCHCSMWRTYGMQACMKPVCWPAGFLKEVKKEGKKVA